VTKANLPLVVAAYSDGAQVGCQPLLARSAGAVHPVTIRLDAAAGGLVRLAAYDYSDCPPRLAAERLVRLAPAESLMLSIENLKRDAVHKPDETLRLQVMATDETGRPAAAALGMALADKAAQGTVGPVNEDFDLPDIREQPPLVYDNLQRLREEYEESLRLYRSGGAKAVGTLMAACFLGGLGLVVLVAMLGALRIVGGGHLWLSALVAVICSLVLAAILTDPERMNPAPSAESEFRPFQPQPDEPPSPSRRGAAASAALDGPSAAETPLWRPLVPCGADGRATLELRLPEKEGVYLLKLRAHADRREGQYEAEIIVGPQSK
jgi:hypothetical protein